MRQTFFNLVGVGECFAKDGVKNDLIINLRVSVGEFLLETFITIDIPLFSRYLRIAS
jgi:hypothetical protein